MTTAADNTLRFHPPRGSPIAAVPPRERVGDAVAWLRSWAEEKELHLGPETNMPRWDGTRPDYQLAVSVLLEAEQASLSEHFSV